MNMVPGRPADAVCRFGNFELDTRTLELSKSGERIKLAPQPARMLALLASRPGELVSRDEIRRELWGEQTFVDFDRNLNYCLTCIRDALGDTARSPRYVETLSRRGYRFIAPVERPRRFPEPTLAVLPFANLNGDPSKEYFADGITDALITELARMKALRVISRQSVLHLKGSSRRLDEIARALSVDGIVEGAVFLEGSRVRVTAQLILTDPERHVWAEVYDCDVSGILTTQREAARAIAACVARVLRAEPAATPAQAPAGPNGAPASPEIVETFLKAMVGLGMQSAQGLAEALHYFGEITAKAPDFAPGLSGYASCLFSLAWWGHAPARELYPTAKLLLERAIAIDDRLDSAHMMLGFLIWLLDWDMAGAEREFLRAIELSPSNPEARIFYAIFLCGVGRHSESITSAEYGLQLNPTSLLPNQAAAWNYLHNGHPERAEALASRTIERFPDGASASFRARVGGLEPGPAGGSGCHLRESPGPVARSPVAVVPWPRLRPGRPQTGGAVPARRTQPALFPGQGLAHRTRRAARWPWRCRSGVRMARDRVPTPERPGLVLHEVPGPGSPSAGSPLHRGRAPGAGRPIASADPSLSRAGALRGPGSARTAGNRHLDAGARISASIGSTQNTGINVWVVPTMVSCSCMPSTLPLVPRATNLA